MVAGFVILFVAVGLLGSSRRGQIALPFEAFLVLVPAAWIATFMVVIGRGMWALRAWEVTASDSRPPILYLRSFVDDTKTLPGLGLFLLLLLFNPMWLLMRRQPSLEEALARAFASLGPFIAIGRPGEVAPPPGAARFYVSHHDWQQRVTEVLIGCRSVVMVLGKIKGNDGLAWEVDQVFRTAAPEKIVLLVPPLDESEVRLRWEGYRARIPGRLPPYQGSELLVTFTPSWEPLVRRVKVGWLGGGRRPNAYAKVLKSLLDISELVRALEDPRPHLRWKAARELAGLGSLAHAAVPRLKVLLEDPDSLVRSTAAQALEAIQGERPT
jgi:hypothetical protein